MNAHRLWVRRAASVKALCAIKDATPEDARVIRHAWHTVDNRYRARAVVDRILRTHGVEFLGVHKRTGLPVYYCNAGDTYATTVCFHGPVLRVCCMGDYLDPRELVRDPNASDWG